MASKKSAGTVEAVEEFSFDPLPEGFVLAKPIKQKAYDEAEIYRLEREHRLIMARKRDGWKHFAVKTKNKCKLYTDGLRDVSVRFPQVIAELNILFEKVPNNSILVGEMVIQENDNDLLGGMQSFMSSKNYEEQLKTLGDRFRFALFGILFLDGMNADVTRTPYFSTTVWIHNLFDGKNLRFVTQAEVLNVDFVKCKLNGLTFDGAKALVKKNNWEGMVLYDADYVYTYRLDGKDPKRVKGCYKWKPIEEDDFVVVLRRMNKDDATRLKDVLIAQLDPKTKRMFSCGHVGGFNVTERAEFLRMKLPGVAQVEYDGRHTSGKLRSPVFMCLRSDKKPNECVATKNFDTNAMEFLEMELLK